MHAIELSGLTKAYGALQALRGVDLTVPRGEVVGLLGPNGAGKTTMMKILTGFIAPTSGHARVLGHDATTEPTAARSALGYLPENAPLYEEMSVADLLAFAGRVRGLGPAERARAIERVGDECGFSDRLGQRVGTLSRGLRQRVGLGMALLHEPPILILDEPSTGLDPNQIVEIRDLIRRVGRTRTVVLSTHILSEVTAVCDRVVILHAGRVVADGPTQEVLAGAAGHAITFALAHDKVVIAPEALAAEVRSWVGVREVSLQSPGGDAVRIRLVADADLRADVFRLCAARGLILVELTTERVALEDVFRRLTAA